MAYKEDLDKYSRFREEFIFPKEKELSFKIPKTQMTYEDLYSICKMCASGVAVDIAFNARGKAFAFKYLKADAKYYQEDDAAKLLDFVFMHYYQSLAQVMMNIHTIAKSNTNLTIQAARLLLDYNEKLNNYDDMKRKMLL